MSESPRQVKTMSLRSALAIRTLRVAFRVASRVAPSLAARAAGALFRLPPQHHTSEPEQELLRRGMSRSLKTGSGRLATWRWGQGPTVLLVHGWGSRGARLGSFVEPVVAQGYSVVAFDAPGHGDSAGRLSSLPQFVEALFAVAAASGPVHAAVGHSMGGAAVALAIARGLSIQRVVLVAPPANPGAYTHLFAQRLAISSEVRELMERRFEETFGFSWQEFDVPRRVASLRLPALVFHDAEDTEVPWNNGASIAQAWPAARFVTTKGLGHRRIVHDPDVIAEATAFLFDRKPERRVAP